MSKTRYYVLKQGQNGTWEEFMTGVEATSVKGALRTALQGDIADGMYVAVPKRNWVPQYVEIQTQQRLKIG